MCLLIFLLWSWSPIISSFPYSLFFFSTLPLISIQIGCTFILLINWLWLAIWLHESLSDGAIYSLFEFFNQWFFLISASFYYSSELLYEFLYYSFHLVLISSTLLLWLFFLSSPNFFLSSVKNPPAISYFKILASKSSNMFFLQISTETLYTYDNIHWIYPSTVTFFILILKYNLHAITNSKTFPGALSNTCGLVTSVSASCVSLYPPSCTFSSVWSYVCIVASCFCCCWIICS